MESASDAVHGLLCAGRTLGLDLARGQAEVLLAYVDQLRRWNRVYNLTALRDPGQILTQHIVDSLSVVAPMRRAVSERTASVTVVDVGSGAGLPGIVMAATNPGWDVFCVDAVQKKTAFIHQMCGALDLPRLHAIHGRIEELSSLRADVVVSRAFASLADFAILAGDHVGAEGCLLAMKGREPEEEIAAWSLKERWTIGRVEPLQVPGLDAQRCLVWIYPNQGMV